MNANDIIQYTLVALCILSAIVWIMLKVRSHSKRGYKGGCCSCPLADSCGSTQNGRKSNISKVSSNNGKTDCYSKK